MENAGRRFKDAIYEQFARIGKALASPKRLELLELICQGPKTVETLARESGMRVANASRHLQVLRAARLVAAERQGPWVTYRLADGRVCEFYRAMRLLAEERLAEVADIKRRFLAGRQGMAPVDRDGLIARIRQGGVTVLDVRPEGEYRAGHLPGALNVPLDRLASLLSRLPRDGEIVAYCRGPYCVLAVEAVELLRRHGFQAVRLEEGVQDWAAMGLPVEACDGPAAGACGRLA